MRGIICLIAVLSVCISLSACSNAAEGYNKYTEREMLADFSFEYPDGYKRTISDVRRDSLLVGFVRSHVNDDDLRLVTLAVEVIRPEPDTYSNATGYLDHSLETTFSTEKGYQVEKRVVQLVAGIEGEFVELLAEGNEILPDESIYDPDEIGEYSSTSEWRMVFFDHDGLIWILMMGAHGGVLEENSPVWDHFLDTFQIDD